MTYKQCIDYLYNQLPVFHRIGKAAYKANLNNSISLDNHLGNPAQKIKCIHIAGTNGKGSVSHYLSAILQEAGYKTGLYTSPHLIDLSERIKINGMPIPKNKIIEFVEKHQTFFEDLQPSFFEMITAMAFDYFQQQKVDFAIIETGLGGRLDSTNIIFPLISVITNISWDHTDLLGETLPLIAQEKAGIIKKNVSVVIGETNEETMPVFVQYSKINQSPISVADEIWKVEPLSHSIEFQLFNVYFKRNLLYENLATQLLGNYQQKNIQTVMEVVYQLKTLGLQIPDKNLIDGIKKVVDLTHLRGRWEILQKRPLMICDTGHNEAGIQYITTMFQQYSFQLCHFVFGVVQDKAIDKILPLLPKNAQYYFCKANIPRGLDAKLLQTEAKKHGLKGESYSSVMDAVLAAKNSAQEDDFIFFGGSTFIVAEALSKNAS